MWGHVPLSKTRLRCWCCRGKARLLGQLPGCLLVQGGWVRPSGTTGLAHRDGCISSEAAVAEAAVPALELGSLSGVYNWMTSGCRSRTGSIL